MKKEEAITIAETAEILSHGVTPENIYGRILRGTLSAYQAEGGEWYVPIAEINRIVNEVEMCGNCSNKGTSFVIVKYHHHNRVEFTLCDWCAEKAEKAYSKRGGGVLEIVSYPLFGEGWMTL